jgi:hypothetical protein
MSEDLFAAQTPPPRANTHELIVDRNNDIVTVMLRVDPRVEEYVSRAWHEGEPLKPEILLRLDFKERSASIFPVITYRRSDLYGPKYDDIREIIFDIPLNAEPPENGDEAQSLIKDIMPLGFMMEAEYGLGFVTLMKPVLYAVEQLEGLKRIVISKHEDTRVERDTFYFSTADYRNLADGMHRITRRYQDESRKDRGVLAYNSVLHRVLPKKYAEKSRPYQNGTIFKLLGGTNVEDTKLKGADRRSLLAVVASNAQAIAKRDFQEFVQLQKDIEIVSLDQLIETFGRMLRRKTVEADWQKLLELNPFILSMLFGQPVIILQPSASVGGFTLTGSGMKIADFVAQNSITHNAAIVELKRPSTVLMSAEYRPGLYSPSPDLMGAVVQVLDQRVKLTTNLPAIKHYGKINDLEAYGVDCVVIAGRTPPEGRIASFELMRSQLKDVRIVTFDELLERLHLLRELLAGERYISPPDFDEEADEDPQDDRVPWDLRILDDGEESEEEDDNAPF